MTALAPRHGGWWQGRRRTLPGLLALGAVVGAYWFATELLALTALIARFGIELEAVPADAATAGGPGDAFVAPLALLLAAVTGCWFLGWARATRALALALNGLATVAGTGQVLELLLSIVGRRGNTGAALLLLDAATVWATNLLVFSVWYWTLDGGGPEARARGGCRPDVAFPQQAGTFPGYAGWTPRYVDYLHLAFRVNISFDNGDVLLLSRRVKLLTMAQAALALVTVGMLAARAIGAFAA